MCIERCWDELASCTICFQGVSLQRHSMRNKEERQRATNSSRNIEERQGAIEKTMRGALPTSETSFCVLPTETNGTMYSLLGRGKIDELQTACCANMLKFR